ncbi:DUF4760 domain-containing protein [Pseudomonas taetrolens]|uniref:DUF4760 domain-containing protein n=1 Tax=Pseudomonas taetrolens TaxID=47884 RepID=UPI003F99BCC1
METICAGVIPLINGLGSELLRNGLLVLGLMVAIISIWTSKVIARRKQTADLMFASRSDLQLSEGYEVIRQLHNDPNGNIRAAFPAQKAMPDNEEEAKRYTEQKKRATQINYVLNHWERVSIGIDEGIYDERMLRYSHNTSVTNLYTQALPYIEVVRERTRVPTYYVDIERLALRWKTMPLKPKKIKRLGFI